MRVSKIENINIILYLNFYNFIIKFPWITSSKIRFRDHHSLWSRSHRLFSIAKNGHQPPGLENLDSRRSRSDITLLEIKIDFIFNWYFLTLYQSWIDQYVYWNSKGLRNSNVWFKFYYMKWSNILKTLESFDGRGSHQKCRHETKSCPRLFEKTPPWSFVSK